MQFLALHGFTGRGSDFEPLAGFVGGSWHCPDMPGHGPDPELDCTPKATMAFVEKHATKLQSWAQDEPKILLGYSMGARAALLHATAEPDTWQALVLISPNPGIESEYKREARRCDDRVLAEKLGEMGIENFIKHWQETPLIRSQKNAAPTRQDAMMAARKAHSSTGLQNSLLQFGQGSVPNLWPKLANLSIPTFVISGSSDEKYTSIARKMATDFPKSIVHKSLSDRSHAPHLEDTECCGASILHFLARFSQ
jgi:2-succinyl-6-hydroxy-2,4-cyclohexadiene-1-carboxylate synthase